MTTDVSRRSAAIRARLAEQFGDGYPYMDVRTVSRAKGQTRGIRISWGFYPVEAVVRDALGDLDGDDVLCDRFTLWACGQVHADDMDAWKAHEGEEHLNYPDCCGGGCHCDTGEMVLDAQTEHELRAAGETFASWCTPGNYASCPTCSYGRIINTRDYTYVGCVLCKGTGVLDLDQPDQYTAYQRVVDERVAIIAKEKAKAAARKATAEQEPGATAAPVWKKMGNRAAGVLNNMPVATVARCDYLKNADDPERRVCCFNKAVWFETTTGLRVCTTHKSARTASTSETMEN